MSCCTTTVPYSVRKSEPVGQTSRQAACVQCLQTSELISQRSASTCSSPPGSTWSGSFCSMKATWRQGFAPSSEGLAYDSPVQTSPSSGTRFHSLQATSQALQPMQTEVSVKKPTRSLASSPYVSGQAAGVPVGSARLAIGLLPHPLDELRQLLPARAPAGLDPDRERLHLLDVHVRVERDRGEVVRGAARRQAARAPVVGQADLVGLLTLYLDRRDPVGHEHARLARPAAAVDRRPPPVPETPLGPPLPADLPEQRR